MLFSGRHVVPCTASSARPANSPAHERTTADAGVQRPVRVHLTTASCATCVSLWVVAGASGHEHARRCRSTPPLVAGQPVLRAMQLSLPAEHMPLSHR